MLVTGAGGRNGCFTYRVLGTCAYMSMDASVRDSNSIMIMIKFKLQFTVGGARCWCCATARRPRSQTAARPPRPPSPPAPSAPPLPGPPSRGPPPSPASPHEESEF
eukprot:1483653-Rhodomonas_salina.4